MRMHWEIIVTRALIGAIGTLLLWGAAPGGAVAEELVASLHPVNAAAKRVDMDASWGEVKFTPGSKDKEVNILVRIVDAPLPSSEEPLTVTGGPTVYRHALQIRPATSCEDTTTDKSLGGELPNVDLRTDGNAELSIKAEGISMSELPGKTVVLYRGHEMKRKEDIVACGVIGPKKS